jgi:hypothetical protein
MALRLAPPSGFASIPPCEGLINGTIVDGLTATGVEAGYPLPKIQVLYQSPGNRTLTMPFIAEMAPMSQIASIAPLSGSTL